MAKKSSKIYIIGAGISGLVAAKTLEENGYTATLLEATGEPGGRVKTATIDGVPFDHGFQVLLTDYPQAKKHLSYDALNLHYFKPGALIFKDGKTERIGDPLRDRSAFWPTLSASIGSLGDKFRIYQLTRKLKAKSIAQIFATEEQSTSDYLKAYGFSEAIIHNFFKPFFTGIFLEEELNTSSRLFEFVFKMFGEGYAALPAKGIGAMAGQLVGNLTQSDFQYETEVSKVSAKEVHLKNGKKLRADIVISTLPLDTNGQITTQKVAWKSCDNLYFTVEKPTFETGTIGLVANTNCLTNNLYYLFEQQQNGDAVLSVTVVKKHQKNEAELVEAVVQELKKECGIQVKTFIKNYHIQQALPDIKNLSMEPSSSSIKHPLGIYMAGDHNLSGSLNAAMASGEAAANAVISDLKA
ncbi:FAD-dependent oxidoreductase [Croceitalea vernalis]|uniref:FAD-dependent oxidoreductase n=1 Tax=Croceitalea vernalis TaxID=3075599 RepID=A0ABU3BEQ6_9FLAO|nr:FAD-dependent oxidoreductase [Croceitalea sp. P007]MDT0620638.1 FAD-dependent oxidoreductase [Croceitalea sp. P007]